MKAYFVFTHTLQNVHNIWLDHSLSANWFPMLTMHY